MRKKKIYLDTSVISYLQQEDAPREMQDTRAFWNVLKRGKYDVCISEVVINELSACLEPKRTELFALLSEVEYTEIKIMGNADIQTLESEINRLGILPPRSDNDRLHIAAAIFSGCNVMVSWNFKHMVNIKTIDGVRVICVANNTNPIDIYSPVVLLERSVPDDE